MAGGSNRPFSDLFGRLGRREDSVPSAPAPAPVVHPTKALSKFLRALTSRPSPVLLDLGPVVGTNVSFFGEQLGCKILVEDLYGDLESHLRKGQLEALPEFFARRFPREPLSIDGILCWDLFDYLERPAAQALASEMVRLLAHEGALLGFFSNVEPGPSAPSAYTRFVVVDEAHLEHRPAPAATGRRRMWLNHDINRMFEPLRVSESFLLKNKLREILFRRPAPASR